MLKIRKSHKKFRLKTQFKKKMSQQDTFGNVNMT